MTASSTHELSSTLIIDFDSTLVQVEALDELAALSLKDHKKRDAVLDEIRAITKLGMDGTITITESLNRRVMLLSADKKHVAALVKLLKRSITSSFKTNRDFLRRNADRIFIFSSGFREYIVPVIEELQLDPKHVFANTFEFDKSGAITGFDKKNPMSQARGKIKQLDILKPKGPIVVIGDGYTDFEMTESKLRPKFFAFTENVEREPAMRNADKVIKSFDEFLYLNKLPMKISYPKSKIRVLLLEAIHEQAVGMLREEGFAVETFSDALDEDELAARINGVSLLGIRSKTKVSAKVLKNADRLMSVGAFCIGTDQMNLESCSESGVVAFNAPYSNTRSVVELAIGEIILLMRKSVESSLALHNGVWKKSASGCFEIRGKKLGIIGYGNIGSQLSVLAEGLGMEVFYFDIVEKLALGNAKRCRTLPELLKQCDVVSIHVDGRTSNKNVLGAKEFGLMKDGAIFLNLSRGHVVEIDALVGALKSGKVAGCAVDVFPSEPKSNKEEFVSPLRGLPNVILTPHVGGSTVEAQRNIGEYVATRMIEYINNGSSFGSVNFPQLQLPPLHGAHRLLHVHRNVPGILAQINSLLAKHKINILGQYLKTNEQVGYVITDVNKKYDETVITKLKTIPDTIKFRVLY